MSHYGYLVIIKPTDDVEAAVERALEAGGCFWRGFQIGGRFSGVLDGYDPTTNPANQEPCTFCEATGTTTQAIADKHPAYQEHVGKACIQCKGTGARAKWPTEWQRYLG